MKDLKPFILLAIPSYVIVMLDNGVWNMYGFISGYLGPSEQVATVLIMNLIKLLNSFGSALEQACATIIGQQIGKGDLLTAKAYL